jgi:glycine oxidase
MLAPYTENADDPALRSLCTASLQAYPAFVDRVRAASNVDPQLRLDGIVHAAYGDADLSELRAQAAELSAQGVGCRLLDRQGALWEEPWLGPGISGALLVGGEGHVDNRRLGRALTAACEALGAIVERVGRVSIACDGRRVLGVHSDLGFTPAAVAINACGAWAGSLPGVPARDLPPIVPVKGQMLALEAPAGFVRHATWIPGAYLVPRADGRVLVGATAEPGIDDVRVTAGGIGSLLSAALAAAPSLSGFALSESWAGVRPGTPDGRPFIGPTGLEGLFVASGHFRNGILLAPITAALIARCVSGERPDLLAPFLLARTAPSAA